MTTFSKWAITLLMGATIFRVQTILFLPHVEMFGGIAPDSWFGRWLSDTIIGLFMAFQLTALGLLFRRDVIAGFSGSPE